MGQLQSPMVSVSFAPEAVGPCPELQAVDRSPEPLPLAIARRGFDSFQHALTATAFIDEDASREPHTPPVVPASNGELQRLWSFESRRRTLVL
jgi:hypothetical protein